MKLLVNKPLKLTVRAEELDGIRADLAQCSVRNTVHGDRAEVKTMVIIDQKIEVPEDDMALILEIFDHGSPVPLVLEYCGYGVTFEIYRKQV